MAEANQPIVTPWAQRFEDFRRRRLPLVVWSLCLLACVWMLSRRAADFRYTGLAQALQYEVSSSTTGRLEVVTVDLFDQVGTGDVLARLDDSAVVAAIETVNATIGQLRAELDAARTQLLAANQQGRADWVADLRRFQIDEEQRRLDALGLRVEIEGDEVELRRIELELDRFRALEESGLMSQADLNEYGLLREQTERRLERNRALLRETEREFEAARARRAAFEEQLPSQPEEEPVLRTLQAAIAVESGRLREIELQRESLVLRSPVDGQVSQVLCRRGQTVVPGEPILTVTERSVREIVAYLDESDPRRIDPATKVLVASRARPDRVSESFVLRVAPGPDLLPQRLWRDPNVPDYGRAVVIAAMPALDLRPGEMVTVRFAEGR